MKKILIVNEGYSDNLGDQEIFHSLKNLLNTIEYEVYFGYYSKPGQKEIKKHNYKKSIEEESLKDKLLNFRGYIFIKAILYVKNIFIFFSWYFKNQREINKIINKHDYAYVIIGGGQLINTSSRYSPNMFAIISYSWSRIIKEKNIKLLYMGIGVADKFNFLEHFFYKKALKKSEKIWVRDSFSNKKLSNLFNLNSEIIPDLVFSEKKSKIEEKLNNALIGVFSFHEYVLKYNKAKHTRNDFYDIWVDKYFSYKKKGFNVKLFYTTKSDAKECYQFKEYLLNMYDEEVEISNIQNIDDLVRILSESKIIFSARMHALILGLKFHCKVEPYFISEKLRSFSKHYLEEKSNNELYGLDSFKSVISYLK